jgi:uncharacterized protein
MATARSGARHPQAVAPGHTGDGGANGTDSGGDPAGGPGSPPNGSPAPEAQQRAESERPVTAAGASAAVAPSTTDWAGGPDAPASRPDPSAPRQYPAPQYPASYDSTGYGPQHPQQYPGAYQQAYPGHYPPAQHPPGQHPSGPYPPGPYPPYGPGGGPAATGRPAAPATRPRGLRGWGAPAPARTHRWGLGAYLLAEAVFLLVSASIQVFLIGDPPPSVGVLILALAAPTLLAAGVGLLITRLRGNGPRIDLRLGWSWREVGLGLAFGFGGLALTIPASFVYVGLVGEDASSAVGDVFGGIRASPVLAVLVLLIVVFVAPLCEEILYRGLLWGGVERLGGRWVACVVTTLLFALAHFELTRTPLLLVVAIPIAVARLYTGRLLPAIVAHQVNNLLPGIVLLLGLLGVLPMA